MCIAPAGEGVDPSIPEPSSTEVIPFRICLNTGWSDARKSLSLSTPRDQRVWLCSNCYLTSTLGLRFKGEFAQSLDISSVANPRLQ